LTTGLQFDQSLTENINIRTETSGEIAMELTYENILNWFDRYFEDVRKNQGDLNTVPELKKYFAPDLELMMYTSPSAPPVKPMSRDALLLSFVHPGLQEDIVPKCYAVDLKQLIVAVRFEIHFYDKPSGRIGRRFRQAPTTTWP